MTAKPSPLEQFTSAVDLAMKLPTPQVISRAILSGTPEVDDGLRAASYDGDRVTGGTSGSHPERMLAVRNPDMFPRDNPGDPESREKAPRTRGNGNRAGDDLYRLSKASERAVDAIGALAAICRDAAPPDTWDDHLWHCDVLLGERCDHPGHEPGDHELGAGNPHDCQTLNTLAPALDIDRTAGVWVERYVAAVDTVRAIRDSWLPHAPHQGLTEANFAWCRPHIRIGVQTPRTTAACCRTCYRYIEDLELAGIGDAVSLQRDPRYWPSEAMLRSNAEGRRAQLSRDRRDWLVSHGADPQTVDRRRSAQRKAS